MSDKPIYWRGSITDLVTDLRVALPYGALDQLCTEILRGGAALSRPPIRRYVVHVAIYHRGAPDDTDTQPDREEIHVAAYDSLEAEREVERHNKRATGVDFVATIVRIEPYEAALHGEWKHGSLLR